MFQRQIGPNGDLDLMERESEFAPPARRLPGPKKRIRGGNISTNSDHFLDEQGRSAISHKAKRGNHGSRVWVSDHAQKLAEGPPAECGPTGIR